MDIVKTVRIDADTGEELEVLASYDYKVDDAGNPQEVVDHNGRKVEYKYDELNRLTTEKIINPNGEEQIITYVYDAVGNLDYKTDSVEGDTDYDYNNLNQLVSSTADGVTTVYLYDDNGNLKSRTGGDRSVEYDWENNVDGKEKAILPNGWQGLVGEQESIILNQIPNENIVQVISARNLPRFDFDESGNIIIPWELTNDYYWDFSSKTVQGNGSIGD